MSTALDPIEPGLIAINVVTADGNIEVQTFGGLIVAVMNVAGWGWTETANAFKVNPLTVQKWTTNETSKPHGMKDHFATAKSILKDKGAAVELFHRTREEPTSADD